MKLKIDFRRLFRERKTKLIIYFSIERVWNHIGGFIFKKFFINKPIQWDQLKDTKEVRLK